MSNESYYISATISTHLGMGNISSAVNPHAEPERNVKVTTIEVNSLNETINSKTVTAPNSEKETTFPEHSKKRDITKEED